MMHNFGGSMFVGREEELKKLEELYHKGEFQMVVLYGRRRVGKTTLAIEFAKGKRALYFTALEQSDQNNLADFTEKIQEFFELPSIVGSFVSWAEAFDFLAEQATKEPFVFIFDEFPYAAQRNGALPSTLQIVIDHKLKNTELFMILCGSNQGFMESKVLGRKSPLYGRRTAQMCITPLGYLDAQKMLPGLEAQDAFRYYGCFGGVPYYLSQVDASAGFRENLVKLYFDPSGFLYGEPMGLLRQELSEPALYNSILRAIAGGANKPNEIASKTGVTQTSLPRYLKTLASLGIIERAVPFGENPETSKRGIYRMMDACYDFWFRFVMPYASDVEAGLGGAIVTALPDAQINNYLGRRFERLCLEWLTLEAKAQALPIPATTVGSWWGTNPETRRQTDIDVLAADRISKHLLIGECKYREDFNVTDVVESLNDKRALVKGYVADHLCIFSKHQLPETVAKANPNVRFVSLEEMYEEKKVRNVPWPRRSS